MGAREPRLSEWQSKSKSSDTIAERWNWDNGDIYDRAEVLLRYAFFHSDLSTRASDGERETDTKLAECIEAKRTHVSTPRFIVCPIHSSRPRLGEFRPEGTKESRRDFFRKMNFLLPFTLASAPLMKARLHKISTPTCVNDRSIHAISMRQRQYI